jgi:hypothetical protein
VRVWARIEGIFFGVPKIASGVCLGTDSKAYILETNGPKSKLVAFLCSGKSTEPFWLVGSKKFFRKFSKSLLNRLTEGVGNKHPSPKSLPVRVWARIEDNFFTVPKIASGVCLGTDSKAYILETNGPKSK